MQQRGQPLPLSPGPHPGSLSAHPPYSNASSSARFTAPLREHHKWFLKDLVVYV